MEPIDKMAACDADEIREIRADFIKKTGFRGIVPTAGKAQNTVSMARYLIRKVRY